MINKENILNYIFPSGNNGNTLKISAPACIKNATSVAASDKADAFAGYSQIPYLLWVSFATALTAAIYILN